jgi:hypothetical protein
MASISLVSGPMIRLTAQRDFLGVGSDDMLNVA